MKNFLTAFVVFMIWSLFGLWIYSLLLPENDSAKVEKEKSELVPAKTSNIQDNLINIDSSKAVTIASTKKDVNDSINTKIQVAKNEIKATNAYGDIVFLLKEGIQISKDKSEVFIPKKSIDYKYKINTYLIEHPSQEVHINSIYSPLELVSNPNIGIKRAFEIEKQLLEIGAEKEKIVLKSIIKDINFNKEGIFNSAINFSFKDLDLKRVEKFKNNVPKLRIVYPKFTNSGISVNNDLKLLLSELIVYFSAHPTRKVEIVGHTDNIGNSADNYAVGLKYAQQVRWYLISKGDLKRTQIKAISKGELEPLVSNNSKKGRITNRRIEVIFN